MHFVAARRTLIATNICLISVSLNTAVVHPHYCFERCKKYNNVITANRLSIYALADPELQFWWPHGERGGRAYNGGLGAEPPAGSKNRAPDQGVRGAKPPEAESNLALRRPTDTTNLHPWPVAVFSV